VKPDGMTLLNTRGDAHCRRGYLHHRRGSRQNSKLLQWRKNCPPCKRTGDEIAGATR
jgi:hypothetical protein